MDNIINRVVRKGLCVRCGACTAACPHEVLIPDDRLFPTAPDPSRCTSCELCILICPGHEVDFPGLYREVTGGEFDFSDILGKFSSVYAASATDSSIRENGGSGGLITALLSHHLREDIIDAALVVTMDRDTPTKPVPILATNVDEVVEASQSKYVVVDPLSRLEDMRTLPSRIAITGLPCQVHGIRKWMSVDRRLREKVRLIIGLVCNMTLEKEAALHLLARKRIEPDDVAKLEFRGGSWPGGIRVTLKDGRMVGLHEGNIKDGAFNFLKRLYYPQRCLMCIDFSNDFADLSVSDPWIRSGSGYLFPHNTSIVITRSSRGEEALRLAEEGGAVTLEEIPASLLSEQFGSGFRAKRSGLAVRIHNDMKRRKAVPDYHTRIPPPRPADRMREALEAALRFPGKHPYLRKTGTFLAFSWVGRLMGKIKESRKKHRKT